MGEANGSSKCTLHWTIRLSWLRLPPLACDGHRADDRFTSSKAIAARSRDASISLLFSLSAWPGLSSAHSAGFWIVPISTGQ
ncbi:unnamed protein product [Protopolystoma xenopodis]|uniref:Uncharacterized protein n=1 Tax=Protopolystoma xenopodis TaxID=117903 RepID=A0A3S5CS96_9PLAT|nr:unnamed protein product [Protopolystoma xenopodis]